MTPEQEKMWDTLQTDPEELRRRFVIEEFEKMIKDRVAERCSSSVDAEFYSSMVKSYYGTNNNGHNICPTSRILDYIKNSA